MPKVSTNINLDADLKKDAQELFHDAVRQQRIPFEIKNDKFNSETEHSINEFYEMRKHPENYKTYSNFSEIIEDMEKSDERIRMIAEEKEKAWKDRQAEIKAAKEEGLEQGLEQGLEKGRNEQTIEIARNLLNMCIVERLEKATGLSKKEIEKLKLN